MKGFRGLIAAFLVIIPLGAFLMFWLHATPEAALVVGIVIGLAIFAVVATGTGPRDEAADAAWREAAPDLPPFSERIALDRAQESMPGPAKPKGGAGSQGGGEKS